MYPGWLRRGGDNLRASIMDPASGIGIPVAFGAGLISFLSPCVLPLVPGYISAVAGVAPAEVRARRVLGPSLAFVASFSAIFIALGLIGQQALHGALTGPTALKVCGAVIVVMGVLFVLAPFVPRLSREWHVGRLMQRAGRGGPVLTGAAFALAWTPCTGPTLGAILTAASVSGSAAHGAFLLAVYCAGLGIPFLVTGLAFGTVTSALSVIRRHYPVVIGAGGLVLIGMGVLIWTGEFTQLNITVNHWLNTLGLPDLNSDT
jgi:cytochrome c-type biogenesis protein